MSENSKDHPTPPRTEELTGMLRESLAKSELDTQPASSPDGEEDDLRARLKSLTDQLVAARAAAPKEEAEPAPTEAPNGKDGQAASSPDVPAPVTVTVNEPESVPANEPTPVPADARETVPDDVPASVPAAGPAHAASVPESPVIPAPSAKAPPQSAADDYVNGISLDDLLSSEDYLGALEPQTQARIRALSSDEPILAPTDGEDGAIPLPGALPTAADEQSDEGDQMPPAAGLLSDSAVGTEEALPNVTPMDLPRGVGRREPRFTVPRPAPRFDPMQISLDRELDQREYYLPSEPQPSAEETSTAMSNADVLDEFFRAEEEELAAARISRRDTERRASTAAAPAEAAPVIGKPPVTSPDAPEAQTSDPTDARPRVTDLVHDREQMLERDTEMYLRLGYEDELRRSAADAARVEKVRREVDRRERVGTRNQIPAAYRGREYTGRAQTHTVEAEYRRSIRGGWIRSVLAALLAVVCLVWDALPLFAESVPAVADLIVTAVYPLVGLGLLVLAVLPFARRLGLGLRSLWDFEPVRYALPACALTASALHAVVTCFTLDPGQLQGGVLFTSAAVCILLLTSVAELISVYAEHSSFRVVSSGKAGFVLTDEAEAQSGSAARTEGRGTHVTLRAARARRLLNYFTWANRYNSRMGLCNILLPLSLFVGLISLCLTVLGGGELMTDGVNAFTASYLACLPASYLFSMSLPLLRVNRRLSRRGCAVIGEAAPERYVPDVRRTGDEQKGAPTVTLSLPDGFAVTAEAVNEITLKGDPDAARHRDMAFKLFALMDCALCDGAGRPREEDLACISAELAESGEQFLKLYMTDTRTRTTVEVMAGTHDALSSRGIRLPKKEAEDTLRKSVGSRILYVAFDRRFGFAVSAEYKLSGAFAHAVRTLSELDCRVSLITHDPLVSPALTAPAWSKHLPSPIGLVRPSRMEGAGLVRSSGIVAANQGLNVCWGYIACRRMKSAYRMGAWCSWLSMLLCGAAVAVLILEGLLPAALLPLTVISCQTLSHAAAILLAALRTGDKPLDLVRRRNG